MIDIRLIAVLPPQGVPPATQGTSSQTPTISVNLPPGSILSGFIVNRDVSGNPVLRTDSGDVTFQTNFFLKIGSEVVIRLENRAGSTLAHILSVDGRPPEVAEQRSGFADAPDVIVGRGAPPTNTPAARGTPAVIVTGIPLAADTPEESPPVTFRVVSVSAPPPQAPPAPEAAAPASLPAQYAAYARAPTAANTAPATATPPPPPSSTPAGAPVFPPLPGERVLTTGQILTVPILGKEPTGETLVQTPIGVVRLQGSPLPQAGKITLEVIAAAPRPLPVAPAPLPDLARSWASLQQIATLLSARPDVPATPPWQPFSPQSPSPSGQAISVGLLLFVSALRGGNFHNWLGEENVKWLEQSGHAPLVKKAEGEFTTLARAFTDPPQPAAAQAQPWQPLFFPLAAEGQLQQVRLFLKRDRKSGRQGEARPEDDTRFIVEVFLSQLGELQMDGFVRRGGGQTEFDLIIRSHAALSDEARRGIQRIYADIGQLTGYRGELAFQAVREFPVNPLAEIAAHSSVIA